MRLDPAQMSRALVNVLENARRHSNGHPVSVRARAVYGGAGPGAREDRIVVRVVDRGPGIAPGQREQVFQPFYRAAPGADHGGSGLGLAIARGFTEANGGTLHVESLPGQGATFVFELPLAGVSEPGGVPQISPASGQASLFGADDSPVRAVEESPVAAVEDAASAGVG